MKEKNREFEENGVFLDVMSKRERRRWEKEQAKLRKMEEKEKKETVEDEVNNTQESEVEATNTPLPNETVEAKPVEVTQDIKLEEGTKEFVEPIGVAISSEELENELEKTKEFMALTGDIPENIQKIKKDMEKQKVTEEYDDEEDDEDDDSSFNPVPFFGFILIVEVAFFLYIVLGTTYDNTMFLIINGALLGLYTFFLGLTALSNERHTKVFTVLDFLIISSFVIFNGLSIVNYDNIYNKVEKDEIKEEIDNQKTPDNNQNIEEPVDEEKITEYNCTNELETVTVEIKSNNDYITYIKTTEVFNDSDTANEVSEFYKDIGGINNKVDDKTLTLEFDFEVLDINQYKVAIESYNESIRLERDFSYIEEDKINYQKYADIELKNLTCNQK